MNVRFTYEKEKDIWCLLNKGKNSNNSQNPTKQYEQLVAMYGESPTIEETADFVDRYKSSNTVDNEYFVQQYQRDWEAVSGEFKTRAEVIFKTTLPGDLIAYLTINSRCPYNIKENYFFVAIPNTSSLRTVMHELWHFYTWYGLGSDQETKIGKEKYNEIKEALTVLINVECKDLLPEGVIDYGYSQHKDLRKEILDFWSKERDIFKLWEYFTGR